MQSLLIVVLSVHQALYFILHYFYNVREGANLSDSQFVSMMFVNLFSILLFWVSAYAVFKTVFKHTLDDLKDILSLTKIAISLAVFGVWISMMSIKVGLMVFAPVISIAVVILFIASWIKWIKKPSSQRVEAIGMESTNIMRSIVTKLQGSNISRIAKDIAILFSLVWGVYSLVLFAFFMTTSNTPPEMFFLLLAISFVSFYIFLKLIMSYYTERNVFVYDNYFSDGSKWKINKFSYDKYLSKRFKGYWRSNLLFSIVFMISFIIYLRYRDKYKYDYYMTEEEQIWALISFSIVILGVTNWVVKYLKKGGYRVKMEQMIGGMNLSGGTLDFIIEQSPKLKAFASVELIRLISLGILERVSEKKEGE